MKRKNVGTGFAASIAIVCLTGPALAQDAAAAGMALPGATAPQAGAAAGDSDHDAAVGRLAVGYLGRATIPVANGLTVDPTGAVTGVSSTNVAAPIVGVRYWIDQSLGLDVGLGFHTDSGTTKTVNGPVTVETEAPSVTAFGIHGGVPLSLASQKHFSFQIVPELNVGFATSTQKVAVPPGGQAVPDIEFSGFVVDVGARAGAEVHFGFIDVPDLSLQAGIGLFFTTQSVKASQQQPTGGETSASSSQTVIQTTVNGEPWDIFTGNIAALYYF